MKQKSAVKYKHTSKLCFGNALLSGQHAPTSHTHTQIHHVLQHYYLDLFLKSELSLHMSTADVDRITLFIIVFF